MKTVGTFDSSRLNNSGIQSDRPVYGSEGVGGSSVVYGPEGTGNSASKQSASTCPGFSEIRKACVNAFSFKTTKTVSLKATDEQIKQLLSRSNQDNNDRDSKVVVSDKVYGPEGVQSKKGHGTFPPPVKVGTWNGGNISLSQILSSEAKSRIS